jgi:hypothetical protein
MRLTRSLSEAMFDPDKPIRFSSRAFPSSGGYTFLSFLGQVHEVDFSGEQPSLHQPWSLVSASERGHWRPGGSQVVGHQSCARTTVCADASRRRRLAQGRRHRDLGVRSPPRISAWRAGRWRRSRLGAVTAVQVSQDQAPLLFAAGDHGAVGVFDALSGRLRARGKHLGQTPWLFLNP